MAPFLAAKVPFSDTVLLLNSFSRSNKSSIGFLGSRISNLTKFWRSDDPKWRKIQKGGENDVIISGKTLNLPNKLSFSLFFGLVIANPSNLTWYGSLRMIENAKCDHTDDIEWPNWGTVVSDTDFVHAIGKSVDEIYCPGRLWKPTKGLNYVRGNCHADFYPLLA